jgi:putative transposase
MSRANRIQYPGALYHVTSRGNRRVNIFVDERDHLIWSDWMAATVDRFGIVVHSFCHMPNHYHLLVETPAANLSECIHYLNSHYAQHFNMRHKLSGHVFQGRFHAILIERQLHLLALIRYIALNPVRAQLVREPEHWQWSSHTGSCGYAPARPWVSDEWLLSQFSGADRAHRVAAYRRFVELGKGLPNPLGKSSERRPPGPPLAHFSAMVRQRSDRTMAIVEAHRSGAYSVDQIAEHFKVSSRTVRRAIQSEDGT